MTALREVVITGLGIVSPIGIGRAAFHQALRDRVSGIRAITRYDTSELAVRFGGELKDFEPKLYVKPRKSLKVMSREIQMGVASAVLAVEDADLRPKELDSDRFGVVYGSPMLYADVEEMADLYRSCMVGDAFDFAQFGLQFPKQMLPLWMLKYLPNMTASHIGIAHGARGPNNTIVQGDISSLLAMIEATTVIQRGIADVMLTGGAGSRLVLTDAVYRGDSNLSHLNHSPEQASRPFDDQRDGMVLGEGAATLVLEERQHAERRGATILGSVLGYSSTHPGSTGLAGLSHGIANSIKHCLHKAGVSAESVGHVNAHGLSDPSRDASEARAIRAVLGDVPVTGVKSYFGNAGAASGVMESGASLVTGPSSAPLTLNYEHPDPDCDVNVVTSTDECASPSVLKLNQAGTGQAAALLVSQQQT